MVSKINNPACFCVLDTGFTQCDNRLQTLPALVQHLTIPIISKGFDTNAHRIIPAIGGRQTSLPERTFSNSYKTG